MIKGVILRIICILLTMVIVAMTYYCNVCCSERGRRRGIADRASESSAHGGVLVYRLQRRTTLHQQAGRP